MNKFLLIIMIILCVFSIATVITAQDTNSEDTEETENFFDWKEIIGYIISIIVIIATQIFGIKIGFDNKKRLTELNSKIG